MTKVKIVLMAVLLILVNFLAIPVQAITTKNLDMQVDVKDIVAPPNVSNFSANPGDRHITLTWDNPGGTDFTGVRVLRGASYYPSSPTDGTVIYDGAGTSAIDTGLQNSTRYYYAAFSYDAAGNLSSGAIASAVPAEPTVAATVETDNFVLPGMTGAESAKKEKVEFPDFKFYLILDEGPLEVGLNDLNELVALKGATLLVAIPANIFAKEVNVATVTLAGSSYLLRLNADKTRFEASFILPPAKGSYEATIVVVYKDGSVDTVQSTILVDPYGYVYERAFSLFGLGLGGETRVKNAEVTLYQKKDNSWQEWPADQFNQKNPQITDATGEFAFLVPNGSYYIEVKKSGYGTVKSAPFEVKDKIINTNVKIFSYWKSILILLILLGLGTGALFLIRRKKRAV